eukprot:14159926-Ditylum_brightwellii.AAC.1
MCGICQETFRKTYCLHWKGTPPDPNHRLLQGKTTDTALTKARMKLAAATLKLNKFKERTKWLRKSKFFQKSHKLFYDSLRSSSKTVTNPPPEEKVTEFWTRFFSCTATHDNDAAWLQVEEESAAHVKEQAWVDITLDELCRTICKTKNWKAPCVDLVHNYWYKDLQALQHHLRTALNGVILIPSFLPKWATLGTTTLLHKKGPESDAKNYRPITCL